MHWHRRAHHLAAENLADGLMAKADAEDRNGGRSLLDQVEADAGIVGRAGAGRQHDRLGIGSDHIFHRDLVIAMHSHVRSEPAQVMEQVEGEAVVIVDQQDHGPPFCCVLKVLDANPSEGQGG